MIVRGLFIIHINLLISNVNPICSKVSEPVSLPTPLARYLRESKTLILRCDHSGTNYVFFRPPATSLSAHVWHALCLLAMAGRSPITGGQVETEKNLLNPVNSACPVQCVAYFTWGQATFTGFLFQELQG